MRRSTIIILALILVLILYVVMTYNSLVKKQEKVKQQWSEVQNTYQRRIDLIPNVVSIVKGISDFEKSTLVAVTEARSREASINLSGNISASEYEKQKRLQDSLAAAANRIIAVIEKYPELSATKAYTGLQAQLEGTERRIRVARNDFNAAVADYNKSVRGFPGGLVAKMLGFSPYEGFQADAGSEKAVEIKFQ
jgi:LemA protein